MRQRLTRIAWFEPFWVLAIGAGLLLPLRFLAIFPGPAAVGWRPLLIALLLAGSALRALAYGRISRRTPLDWPFLLLILCIPVSLWASADRNASLTAAGYLVFGLAVYLALVNWPPAVRRPEIVAWALMGLGLAIAMAAPLMSRLTVTQFSRLPFLGSAFGAIGPQRLEDVNVNVLAGSLVLVLPLYISMALRSEWKQRRTVAALAVGALAILTPIVITGSRGAYLAAASGIAVVLVLRWPRLLYAAPIMLGAGVIAGVVVGPVRSLQVLSLNGALGGLSGRAEVWSRALFAMHDFGITGIGLGTFSRLIPAMYPYLTLAPDFRVDHAHNLFLQVGLDLGIPGLIAYLAILMNSFVLLGRVLHRRSCDLVWCVAAGTAGGLTAVLAQGVFDATLWNSRPAFLAWVLVALCVLTGLWETAHDAARSGSSPESRASAS